MMVFQGPPYDEEKFHVAIAGVSETIKKYDPEIYGFRWSHEDGPRFQLAPNGAQGIY